MHNYYFVYLDGKDYPFSDGHSVVKADSIEQAISLFRAVHPDKEHNVLNCASYYDDVEWSKLTEHKIMETIGHCRETISLNVVRSN